MVVLKETGEGAMIISLRLNKTESDLFKKYAEINGISVSELIRRAVLEKIEDEYDLKVYRQALAEFQKHPITYSLKEVERELGLQ